MSNLKQETLLKSLSEQISQYNSFIKTLPDYNAKYKRLLLTRILSNSGQSNRKHWKAYDPDPLQGNLLLYYKEWKIRYQPLPNYRPAERDDKYKIHVFKSDVLVKHIVTVDTPPHPDYFLTIQSFIELN